MRQLLIVDDERNIRLGMKVMINRKFPHLFDIFLASNGVEAMHMAKEQLFDIVITDIKMPQMDGIQLMKELHQLKRKPFILVLSGYDDFQYAKDAIKCEVKDYLLKPVNRIELYTAMERVLQELKNKEVVEKNVSSVQQKTEELRSSQLNYILLHPTITEEEIKTICERAQLDLLYKPFYIAIIKGSMQEKNIGDQVIYQDTLKVLGQNGIWFIDKNRQLVILVNDIHWIKKITEKLPNLYKIGISEKGTDITNFKECYRQAAEALKYHFLLSSTGLIFYEEYKNRQSKQAPIEMIKKIGNMLGTDREAELKLLLMQVLNHKELELAKIQYVEEINHLFNNLVFDKVFNKLGESSVDIFQMYHRLGSMYLFDTVIEYARNVNQFVIRLNEYLHQIKQVYTSHNEMEAAVTYIKYNYMKELNLAIVSNHVSLNYSYFSHAFKEYTGANFVAYLRKVRIEKAKELLTHSNEKVYEISEIIGYKNPKLFSRVFRELEGISPQEYRNHSVGSRVD